MNNGDRADLLVPIIVGITGHRDIPVEDCQALKVQIQLIFDDLKKKYPLTPVSLISSLAEGADRIAAEVAIENSIKLIVPLPLPQDEYARDFESSSSREDFVRLLAKASVSFEIPLVRGNTAESIKDYGPARDRQYFAAGRFMVEHCQILIALWDGITNEKVGGTGDIVELQLLGDTTRTDNDDIIFNPIQTGPVYNIVTRRKSEDGPIKPDKSFFQQFLPQNTFSSFKPFAINILYPLNVDTKGSLEEEQQRVFACIDTFNRDAITLSNELATQSKQSVEWLMSIPTSSPEQRTDKMFTKEDLSGPQKELLEKFAIADAMAIYFQKDTYTALYAIACFIPLIVFFFEMYLSISSALIVIAGYLAPMACAYGVYYWSKQRKNQEKFLDYRALAEGLRVQFFWKLAGLHESVASDYLGKQQSELDWIRQAIRNWSLLTGFGNNGSLPAHEEALQAVKTYWVQGQAHYYRNAAFRQKEKMERLDLIAKVFFSTAMFVLTPAMLTIHKFKLGGDLLDNWMQVVTPASFVIAGAINYYNDKMLFSAQVKQYTRMGALFNKALKLLDANPDNQLRSRDVLLKLGKEAIAENGDWLLMHRERPIEVPQG